MAENAFFDIYPELDPLAFDIGSDWNTSEQPTSKAEQVKQAAAEKIAALAEWNSKGFAEKLGLGVLAGTERALGNVIQAPGNIAQSFAQGTLEPESVLMQNQAIDAENKLRNLSRQINGGVSSPAMLREQAIEQERFNQAKSWLSQPINTEKTSGIFGKLAPQLFGSDYTRADALAGNERLTEAVSAPAMFGDALKESAASRVNQGQYETVNPIFDEAATTASKGWKEGNAVTGAAKFVGESLLGIAKAVIADPESSAVKMSESLINTITAAHPLAATINYGGLFTDGRATAYKDFQKEHGGKLPTASESAIIDTAIGASVLSELAGDVLQIKMVPLLQKVLKNSPDTIPTSVKADLVAKFPKLQELAKETGKIAAIPALEGTQGGFQELADQYAVKQDLDKIDSKKVARGAIEEGFAAAAMGGVAALSTPGKVAEAGRENATLKQSTKASEAFKATDAYKPFTEVKEAPVAAFRAFEKVVADQASTSEQKQAAFDTAFGSLVNTPQFNTQKIASSLVALAKDITDLSVPPEIGSALTAMAKPVLGTVAKAGDTVTKVVDKGLQRIKANANEKTVITDDLVKKDPVFAMELLANKPIEYTDQADYENKRAELLKTYSKIKLAAVEGGISSEASLNAIKASEKTFVERIETLNKSFAPIAKVVEAVTTSTKDASGKVTFGSSADALAGREDELSVPQIDSVLASGNVSAEQKAVLEAVKIIKVRKLTDEVTSNVEEKSDGGMISVKDHMATITTSITLGDKAQAEIPLAKLKKFAAAYAIKAQKVADAFAEANKTGKTQFVDQIDPKAEKLAIISSNDGKGSARLVANITSNNALIQAKFLQAQNHFNVAFKGKTNAPQATQTVTPKAQQSQVPATTTAVVKNLNGVAAVNAAEAAGEGISTLRKDGNQHYGNPFTSRTTPTTAEIKVSSVKEAVDAYRAWLRGTAHQQVRPEQRTWILAQIAAGALDGKTLLYYTQLNEPSHADALAEFVNTPKNETGSSSEPVVTPVRTAKPPHKVKSLVDSLRKIFGLEKLPNLVQVHGTMVDALRAVKLTGKDLRTQAQLSVKSDRLKLTGTGIADHWFQYNEGKLPPEVFTQMLALVKQDKKAEAYVLLTDYAVKKVATGLAQKNKLFPVHRRTIAVLKEEVNKDSPSLQRYIKTIEQSLPRWEAAYDAGAILDVKIELFLENLTEANKEESIYNLALRMYFQQDTALDNVYIQLEDIADQNSSGVLFHEFAYSSILKAVAADPLYVPVYESAYLSRVFKEINKREKATASSFELEYSNLINKADGAFKVTDELGGYWIKYPQLGEDSDLNNDSAIFLTNRSLSNWCTSKGAATEYLKQGDFWIYVDSKNNTKYALQLTGDGIGQMQNSTNSGRVDLVARDRFTWLANSSNLNAAQSTNLNTAINDPDSIDTVFKDDESSKLDLKTKRAIDKILKQYNGDFENIHYYANLLNTMHIPTSIVGNQLVIQGDFDIGHPSLLYLYQHPAPHVYNIRLDISDHIGKVTGDLVLSVVTSENDPFEGTYLETEYLYALNQLTEVGGTVYINNDATGSVTLNKKLESGDFARASKFAEVLPKLNTPELIRFAEEYDKFNKSRIRTGYFSKPAYDDPEMGEQIEEYNKEREAEDELAEIARLAYDDEIPFSKTGDDGKVQGFVYQGKVHLIAENIEQGKEFSVILHELGVHLGMQKLFGEAGYNTISDKVNEWLNNPKSEGHAVAVEAQRRAIAAGTTEANMKDEMIAYFVEVAVEMGYHQKPGTIKAWYSQLIKLVNDALKGLGLNITITKPEHIVQIAHAAALQAVNSPKLIPATPITKGKYTPVRTDRLSLTVPDNNPTYIFGETLFTKDDKPLETVAAVFDKDSNALQVLQDIAKSISSSTDSTIQYHPDQNPLIDFMEDDGKTVFQSNGKPKLILNKAIVNAAAIVGFNYIGSRSGSLLLNPMKTIKQMFGFQDEERLPFETAEAMRFIGKNRNSVADDLGAEIYAMLGMSVKGSVERKRIQHALGFIAIRGLVAQKVETKPGSGVFRQKYLEEKYIEKSEYDGFFKPPREGEENRATGEKSDAPKVAFVHAVLADIEQETDPIEGTQEIEDLKALFTPEVKKELKKLLPTVRSNEIDPITNPKDTVVPKTLSNSNQVLTEVAKKAVETANARPYSLNRSVYDRFMELYDNKDTQDALLKSMGYTFGTEDLQIYNRITAEDNNKLILKQIADLQSYVEALPNPDTLVYFNHDIWANQRIGLNAGSGISPQGSKLIRHMFTLDSAKIEIDPSTKKTKEFQDFITEVRRSIAQGFGADGGKLEGEQIDEQYNLLLQDPHIKALRTNPKDSAALLAVLDDHGEGTHTFEAVMSLIALENGLNGKTPFSLTTMVEVDGKTNGLGIAMAQFFGVSQDALSTVLDAVGLFQDPKKEHYVESMVGKPDLYQGLARETAVIVAAKRREADNNLWRIQQKYVSFLDIEKLIDPKVMKQAREIVKYPLMTVVFGKAITTLKRDFGELLFQLMIDKVEKADLAGIQEINADIEGLTGIKDAFPTENWLEHKLPDGTIRDIVASMSETYGASVAEAIEAKFAPLYAMRNVLNKAANTVSDIFIAAVAKKTKDRMLTKEYLKELMETPIAEGGLQEFLPAFHTVHSKNLNEGFLVLDIAQARANDANPVQVTYGPGGAFTPIPGSLDTQLHPISKDWKKTKQYSHTGNITQIKLDNAGVGALIGFIHSFDGALMQSFLTQVEAFGVHDAAYMNPHNSPEGRQLLNKLFIEQHNNYSIAESINNRYLEVMDLLNKHPDLVDLDSRKIRKNMEELAAGTNKVESLALTVSRIKEVRATELPKIVNVAQFAAPNSGVKNPNSNVKDVEVPAEMSMEEVMQSMIDEVINEPTKTGPYQRRTPEPRSLISTIQDSGGLTLTSVQAMFGGKGKGRDYNWLKALLVRKGKDAQDTSLMAAYLQENGIINPGNEDPAQYLESLIGEIASGSKIYADMDGAASYNYEQEILSQANTLGIPTNRRNIEDIRIDLELLNNLADALAQDPKNKDQLIAAFRCRRKGK